jgi:hypothetical protein
MGDMSLAMCMSVQIPILKCMFVNFGALCSSP